MARNEWQRWYQSPYEMLIRENKDAERTETFIKRLLALLHPGAEDRILVTECGTGETATLIHSLGFDTTGTDYSAREIDIALQKEDGNLHFYQHDLRLPFWSNYFNLALNLFGEFGFYDTQREHDNVIRTISGSLRTGGTLVIDYPSNQFTEQSRQHSEPQQIGDTLFQFREWMDETSFYRNIRVSDATGALTREPEEFTEKRMRFTLGDLTDMLSFQGLQIRQVYGDYDLSSYDAQYSPRMIVLAQKQDKAGGDREKRLYSDGRTTDALT